MKYLVWLLRAAVFLLLLGFAVMNDGSVVVHAYFDTAWRLPLVVVMLVMLACGVLLGATATVGTLFSLRREVRRLKKMLPAVSPHSRLMGRRGGAPDSF